MSILFQLLVLKVTCQNDLAEPTKPSVCKDAICTCPISVWRRVGVHTSKVLRACYQYCAISITERGMWSPPNGMMNQEYMSPTASLRERRRSSSISELEYTSGRLFNNGLR